MFSTLPVLRLRVLLVAGIIAVTPFLANQVAMASLPPGSTTTTLAMTSGGSAVASGGSVVSGSVVTLTATVTGAGNMLVTVGQVKFCDATATYCEDIHILGTAQLTKAGTAVFMFRPSVGSHSYKAVFVGTNSDAGSTSGTSALLVTGLYPTAVAIAQSGSVGNYTLTATVGGTAGTAPTGTVSFLDTTEGNKLLGTATLNAGSPGLNFVNSATLATGLYGGARSIAVADFLGNGIKDLALALPLNGEDDAGSVLLFLGNGDGTFQAPVTVCTYASDTPNIAVADFNGDGIPDLALLTNDSVVVLLGNGDGTFRQVYSGGSAGTLAVGDFNGDGVPDLLVSVSTVTIHGIVMQYSLQVLLGNGDGTFTPAQGTTSIAGLGSVVVADFNGDGKLDVAIDSDSGAIVVLLGNGDGTFTAAASLNTNLGGLGTASFVLGDFNGDGVPDLATAVNVNNEVALAVFIGTGNGTFTALPTSPLPGGPTLESIGAGDLIGNGNLDLAVAGYGLSPVTVLLGNGNGTFTTAGTSPQAGSKADAIVVGDFNGDGTGDLVTLNGGVLGMLNSSSATANVLMTETQSATAAATGVAVLPAGTGAHQVVASYSGDTNNAASTSSPTPLTAGKCTPTASLTVSPNPADYAAPVTLTATVTGSGLTPIGTVTFYDGTTLLSSSALNSSGVATISWTAFTVGQHSITANYGGDGNYLTAVSPAVALTVGNTVTPTMTVTPSSPSIITTQAMSVTVAVSGGSGNPTPTGSVTLTSGSYASSPTTLNSGGATISVPAGSLAVGTDTLKASYTPDSASAPIYKPAAGSVSVTVNQLTPNITWATPAAITYGTALSAAQLDASSTVAGTFAYNPAAGTVLKAGSQTLSATFTPTDATDYATAKATVTLTVNQATPTITWAMPAAITYGAGLGSGQLNATSSVAGSFAYSPVAGTILSVGTQTLNATFTPTDTTDYTTASATVTLTVNQATPTIAWATPAAITYGAGLSSGQLNATASVAGTFVYNPALGTIPPVGNDTLSVTFTPTDSVDYATATSTVILTVNTPSNPVPVMGSMNPAIADAGGTAFTLTVNGAGFLANSTINWGTTPLATSFVSATQLTAQVTAADIATAGAYAITVQTPAPGGGTTGILQFEVDTAGSTATGPTFTSTTVTVTAGSSASYAVTLPSTVTASTVSCLNLPPGASCSYSATSNTVTITTSAATPAGTYQVTVVFNETVSGASTSWILLPILLLPLVFLRRRMAARGAWVTACLGLVLLVGAALCSGCGGGGGGGGNSGGGGGGGGTQAHQVTSSSVVTLTVQ